MHKVQVGCFMFQVRHGKLPEYFNNMFFINSDIHMYATQCADDYHVSFSRTNLFKNTIQTAGPILWNTVNSNIKNVN